MLGTFTVEREDYFMHLSDQDFLEVITRTPLVSIDLVVRNPKNRILLGFRTNEPAKGKWFVPGGRIKKGENIEDAFQRICLTEIKETHSKSEARLIGVFTHIHDKNVFLVEGIRTHYVVLAYELRFSEDFELQKTEQHSKFRWFTPEEVDPPKGEKAYPDVHKLVVPYFRHPSQMAPEQYDALNARRDSFNNLLWQTPVLSLTAQAFLFTIIFSTGASTVGRIVAGILSAIIAVASLQLLAKHRFMEKQHAKILHTYEDACKPYAANRSFKAMNRESTIKPQSGIKLLKWFYKRLDNCFKAWTLNWSSYLVWRIVLWTIFYAALLSLGLNLSELLSQ
jgi:colanic acid biosynthesis protein WcaH